MNIRGIVKVRSSLILTVVLLVNILCLMSITMQNMSTWRPRAGAIPTTKPSTMHDSNSNNNNNRYGQASAGAVVESSSKSQPRHSVTTAALNLTLNPAVLRKVNTMHQVLNQSRFADGTVYPAMRIGRYLMVHRELCSHVDRVHLVIIVHTAPANLGRRQRIRETFGKRSLFYPFNIRVAFLLGKTLNTTLERVLWMEHARYNDTVMGDFIDDYHNLTLKGVMGYRWVSQYCSNSEIVLKIDDDVFVNTYKLLYSFLPHMRGKPKSIFCNLWHKNTMPILRQGKWKVDNRLFSKMNTFPYDYCSGFVVLLSTDLMGPMHQAAMTTPFFWIDDVYLFGMLPSVVGGVTFYNYALDKNVALNDQKAINCTVTQGASCAIFGSIIADHNYWRYWQMISNLYVSGDWRVENKLIE
ncbi:hexosyltransferase [Plakobranchus ocellatus]|uniref:Hexosyltransferase n=1 Tax=Plakobranchus ocellatus TaxID=259542 RepID=A0AAV3Z1Q6_9GAST|nr:hexosyltransferase [Plakobranchus ocellatus]